MVVRLCPRSPDMQASSGTLAFPLSKTPVVVRSGPSSETNRERRPQRESPMLGRRTSASVPRREPPRANPCDTHLHRFNLGRSNRTSHLCALRSTGNKRRGTPIDGTAWSHLATTSVRSGQVERGRYTDSRCWIRWTVTIFEISSML